MECVLGSSSAEWAGVIATAAAGLIALALLIFEIRTAHSERLLRKETEATAARDLALERARRVVGWLEPVMWQTNREGVVARCAGGWKLVVSNDTDDTVSNWRATVVTAELSGVDQILLEAAVVDHGVIPPRSRFEADLPMIDVDQNIPPAHHDLIAIVVLWWMDRDASAWHSRGAAGPFSIPIGEGRWSVHHPKLGARQGGVREVFRPGFTATRLN